MSLCTAIGGVSEHVRKGGVVDDKCRPAVAASTPASEHHEHQLLSSLLCVKEECKAADVIDGLGTALLSHSRCTHINNYTTTTQ
jgi:hypothetical protein